MSKTPRTDTFFNVRPDSRVEFERLFALCRELEVSLSDTQSELKGCRDRSFVWQDKVNEVTAYAAAQTRALRDLYKIVLADDGPNEPYWTPRFRTVMEAARVALKEPAFADGTRAFEVNPESEIGTQQQECPGCSNRECNRCGFVWTPDDKSWCPACHSYDTRSLHTTPKAENAVGHPQGAINAEYSRGRADGWEACEAQVIPLLRSLEWRGHNGYCPACDGWDGSGSGPRRHWSKCELSALLQRRPENSQVHSYEQPLCEVCTQNGQCCSAIEPCTYQRNRVLAQHSIQSEGPEA